MSRLRPTIDGVVLIRPPQDGDAAVLAAGVDDAFRRWIGPGADEPKPVGCVVVDGSVVGWVDYDVDHEWQRPGEVNLGLFLFESARGLGYGSRAVHLLLHHLAIDGVHRDAVLLIDNANVASVGLATRTGFARRGALDNSILFARPVPPLSYTDGAVTIRRQRVDDLDADLAAKDPEQMRWMWLPGERERWESLSPDKQRQHARRGLAANHDAFGAGPKWTFAVDANEATAVAYVDCDLANEAVPAGEANVAFSTHPAHRRRGYAHRAVLLTCRFLVDHTAAPRAHLVIDADNHPSLRVAAAVGAVESERWVDAEGRTMIRHVRELRRG